MNVLEGLQHIRDRLIQNDADPATIQCVDQIMRRAALPAAAPASANSLLQLVRMLARTPVANSNVRVYNDLVRLEEELDTRSEEHTSELQSRQYLVCRLLLEKNQSSSSSSTASASRRPGRAMRSPRRARPCSKIGRAHV